MYNDELTLIGQTLELDDVGNQIPVETRTTVLCKKETAGRNEFYNAAAAGHKAEYVFVIHGYEYNGEALLEFADTRYKVIRTYQTDFEEIELTVERVIGDG